MIRILILSACFVTVSSFPNYALEIPNGFEVPDPCPGVIRNFPAVGHWQRIPHELSFNFDGRTVNSFDRNPFGIDYEVRKNWSAICRFDSDGDGRTNGQELGDPDCTWTKGGIPKRPATSHPGIREFFSRNGTIISRSVRSRVKCDTQGSMSFA